MRWKVDALIETRLQGPASEAEAKKAVQAELWRLVDELEAALGISLATSLTILGVEQLPDDDG